LGFFFKNPGFFNPAFSTYESIERCCSARWQVLSGNIEHVPTKEKAKFAQEFFPDV